jgi:hypothetical protein
MQKQHKLHRVGLYVTSDVISLEAHAILDSNIKEYVYQL